MGLAPDQKVHRLGFEARHMTSPAGRVAAIAVEKDSHVHLISFFVHVLKEIQDAHKIVAGIALKDPFAIPGLEFCPWHPDRNALALTEVEELPLLPAGAGLSPGLDGPVP